MNIRQQYFTNLCTTGVWALHAPRKLLFNL